FRILLANVPETGEDRVAGSQPIVHNNHRLPLRVKGFGGTPVPFLPATKTCSKFIDRMLDVFLRDIPFAVVYDNLMQAYRADGSFAVSRVCDLAARQQIHGEIKLLRNIISH